MNRHRIINDLYRAWAHIPFAWGSKDCLYWASACAKAIIGRDPAAALKRRYTSRVGALRVMRREGWKDMGDVAASLLPEVPLGQAVTGDWVHVRDDHGHDGLGVVNGHLIAVRTEAGMGLFPLLSAKRAFRVE
jgi:hypothetical protein